MYRACRAEGDAGVAVKWIRLDLSSGRVARLLAELERIVRADLAHPAIAAPIDAGMAGASPYLAAEFVTAESLELLLHNYGPAPAADAVRVATQLAGALDFANVVNVRHGALHPRDVFVSPDEVRITGLGVGQALEEAGLGVPVRRPYTAPEIIAGRPWDRRADIYSLAAVVYELLWGRRLTATGPGVADSITVVPDGDVATLRHVFAKALAEDPSARHETALSFVEELTRALAMPSAPVLEAAAVSDVDAQPRQSTAPRIEAAAGLPTAEPAVNAQTAQPPEGDVRLEEDQPSQPVVLLKAEQEAQPNRFDVDELVSSPDDLTLRAAEAARYEAVESAPAVVPLDMAVAGSASRLPVAEVAPDAGIQVNSSVRADPAAPLPAVRPERRASLAEQRRRSAAGLFLAGLAAALVLGFIAGRFTNVFRLAAPAVVVGDETSPVPVNGTPPREFTETALTDSRNTQAALAPPQTDAIAQQQASTPPGAPSLAATAPGAERTPEGRLLVRSTPAGARVFVDGEEAGETPATMRDIGLGAHTIRVMRDGYTAQERRVTLSADEPSLSLTFELARPRVAAAPTARPTAAVSGSTPTTAGRGYVGALIVESRPSGARVFLDGRSVGTTPLTLTDVSAGEHAIRLELEGFRRWTASVRVVAEDRNRVAASLDRVE